MTEQITAVDFHFDIMCPWAYQASLWMREVRDQLKLDVRWRFFSLEEINRAEGKKHPWEREWSYGWSMMRVGALLRTIDPALVDRWYLAAGTALHVDGRKPHRPEVAEELLAGIGLDPALVRQAIDDPTTHDDVRADHDRVTGLGGWGVPTLVFARGPDDRGSDDRGSDDRGPDDRGPDDRGPDNRGPGSGDRALFGPVLIEPPSGEAAVRLWRLLTGWLEFPRSTRSSGPSSTADLQAIATTFRPYLEARDWITIQKETP